MRFNLLADFFQGTRVDEVLFRFNKTNYRHFFANNNYGEGLNGITIVLMCQDPSLNLKQRIRHSQKEKKLYIDIMLDMHQFMNISDNERVNIVAKKLLTELPSIVEKYKFKHFDSLRFENDLKNWLTGITNFAN